MSEPSSISDADRELAALRYLSAIYPTIDSTLAAIARLQAELTLPKGTIHVISDVHGEDVKLRHVINNASGRLRPVVEQLFAARMSATELKDFLALVFYPREMLQRVEPTLSNSETRTAYVRTNLHRLFEIIRLLVRDQPLARALTLFPAEYRDLFQEMMHERNGASDSSYLDALVGSLARNNRGLELLHVTVRLVRNLAIHELINAGDFWDRGARGDRVMDYLMRQPNVAITWGNHDAAWLGACLGSEACIAHVLRISCRYRRLSQLEEGYGITLQPLEHLIRVVYANDPATCFKPKGTGLREVEQMARLQKAAAVMQYKLEGQLMARRPEWGLENRRLLHRVNLGAGTVEIDGVTYPLKDTQFPTIDPHDPYELSTDEKVCMARLKQSFLSSRKLWEHMQYMISHGGMYLVRDQHLIFHGCVPSDASGEFQPLVVEGKEYRGKALFDVLDRLVLRVLDRAGEYDRDLMWYLWCGARSPLFGKDRITTFENDLIADPKTHVETKDPYFSLIHEVPFCDKVLAEFGVDPKLGLIVNGHVPVKVEKGENPVKRSGKAITIDGAFSSAYGDHGFTLMLEADRTVLARHYHFESVEAAIADGVDIIPQIEVIRQFNPPHHVIDTERGIALRAEIALLEHLVEAYRSNKLHQKV